jgi:predicted dehydrogenase/NADPH:quinone reductase-like Zn-dependent oxidoreductase
VAAPDLLTARVPEGVAGWQAAYTTIAAIGLQAVRQCEVGVGARVLVMGQGLIGLLVTNLLAISGVRVLAVDLQESRRSVCLALGAERVAIVGAQDVIDEVRAWTDGYGVDAVVLCTSGSSNAPLEQAAAALRDRGRIVVVGNTRADLDWKVFFEKEIEVRYSRSYGPGRYDPGYEWGGVDYPIGYVRWTEARNFEACLQLMRTGQLRLGAITTRRAGFEQALEVYRDLMGQGSADIGVVLEYSAKAGEAPAAAEVSAERSERPGTGAIESKAIRLGGPVQRLDVIGAGNFARTMLLPHLRGRLEFGSVVNQTALSANHVKAKFGFGTASTDAEALLAKSGEGSAVLIATRHHLHGPLVKAALEAGRHVFVEKPLCLTRGELEAIDALVVGGKGSVMVGFNRRFAPASVELRRVLAGVPGPKAISYRVAAGKLDPQHWYANYRESGGRVLGEACHFLDYFGYVLGAAPVRVWAQTVWPTEGRLPFPDSVTAQVEFAEGSSAQLIYTAEGDPGYPKETVTVLGAGVVAEVTNFQQLAVYRGRKCQRHRYGSKGHAEEMAAWVAFLRGEADHPLPYAEARRSMQLTFAVLQSIQERRMIEVCSSIVR